MFLRLRKAVLKAGLAVHAVAPFATRGLEKLSGRLLATAPGTEAAVLDALAAQQVGVADAAAAVHGRARSILVGERLAAVPGALSAAAALAEATGARLAWVPRRAGERGALEAGALPGAAARWPPGRRRRGPRRGRRRLGRRLAAATAGPRRPPRILAAVHTGRRTRAARRRRRPGRPARPRRGAGRASTRRAFVVSLELRPSDGHRARRRRAAGRPGGREGRHLRRLGGPRAARSPRCCAAPTRCPTCGCCTSSPPRWTSTSALPDVAAARAELAELGAWDGDRAALSELHRRPRRQPPATGEAVLATWPLLLDAGRLQDGEPYLAGTARAALARLSAGTAAAVGVTDGDLLTVSTDRGSVSVPVVVTEMPDGVVWLPTNSAGCAVRSHLAARHRFDRPAHGRPREVPR